MPVGLLGKKLGQTRVYSTQGRDHHRDDCFGRAQSCAPMQKHSRVTVTTPSRLGFDDQKEQRISKPLQGHIKKFNGVA
jgi:hypothetical protein